MENAAVKNLGWANEWKQEPEIVTKCKAAGHDRSNTPLPGQRRFQEYMHEVRCDTCGYVYRYDSSG